MSTALVQPLAPEEAPRRRLRALEAPRRRKRPKVVYAAAAIVSLLIIGAAQVGLSLAITQDSFALAELRGQQRELALQVDAIGAHLNGLTSPQYLAANAGALGMVPAAVPAYLRLSDGKLLGKGKGAHADRLGTFAVGNALVADTPLITAPGLTLGSTAGLDEDGAVAVVPQAAVPAPLSEGLPTPNTR